MKRRATKRQRRITKRKKRTEENALLAQMQVEDESNSFVVLSNANGKATQFLEEAARKEEEKNALFAQMEIKSEHDPCEVLSAKEETMLYFENTRSERRKLIYEDISYQSKKLLEDNKRKEHEKSLFQQRTLSDANTVVVIKKEEPSKNDILLEETIGSLDQLNTYCRLLIDDDNHKESGNINTSFSKILLTN